jgi:flagellar FliL protein
MADMDVQFEDGAQLKKGKGLLFVIVGVVVVLGGVGAYLATSGGNPGDAKAAPIPSNRVGPIIPVAPFVINLNESGNRYLKVRIDLEMSVEGLEEEAIKRLPIIRDKVITYLASLSLDDVRGAETKEVIRTELIKKINEAFGADGTVKKVLFQEFVIQ